MISDAERRFAAGTGPEPRRYWGRPEPARLTGSCSDCGAVFYLDEGHACSARREVA
jgi:hypothetical protein